MRSKILRVFLLVCLMSSVHLMAFDGERKGFILGGGVGGGYLSNKFPSFTLNKFAIGTNFVIGYAPTNSFEIYYLNTVSWWFEDTITLVTGLTGIGATKYFNPKGSGLFITGGIGVGVHYAPFEEGNASYGLGLLGGIGFDIAKHWRLQGEAVFVSINDGFYIKSLGFRLTLNTLAF
jgi:hypothetical protein